MLPYATKSLILPSPGYSYVLQPVDGRSVMAMPWEDGRRSVTTSNSKVDRKRSKVAESFEIIAKRNGIKISNPVVGGDKNDAELKLAEKREIEKMSAVDCFEMVARRNGIRVSSSGELNNENGVPENGHSFGSRGQLSPLAKTFASRNDPLHETVNSVCDYFWTDDCFEIDGTGAAGLSRCQNNETNDNGVVDHDSVDNADVLKMFEVILEEKKQFERKQFQILQGYINEQKSSKKEIDSLMIDKTDLQDKVKALTNKLEVLEKEKDSAIQESRDEALRQRESISNQLSENIRTLEERNSLLSNEVDVMTEKLIELTERDVRLNSEVNTLSHRLEGSEKMNDSLIKEREVMTRQLNEHEITNTSLIKEREVMTRQLSEYEITNTSLSKETEAMARQLSEYERMNLSLNKEVEVKTRQLGDYERMNSSLSKETEVKTRQLSEYERMNSSLSEEAEVMTRQLSEYERMNSRRNFVDICTQTESQHYNGLPTSSRPLSSIKKCAAGSMDSVDKITMEHNDYDWSVVKHTKKIKAETENCPSNSPTETSQTVANKPRSLSEISLNDEGLDPTSLRADSKGERVEVPSKKAPIFDCDCEKGVALHPILSNAGKASVVDRAITLPLVGGVRKPNTHSACAGVSQEIKTTGTLPCACLDAGTSNAVVKTRSSVSDRRSSTDGSAFAPDNTTTSKRSSVNTDTATSIADTGSLSCDDMSPACASGTKLNSEAKLACNPIKTNATVSTLSTAGATKNNGDRSAVNSINGISEDPLGCCISVEQSFSNLDSLAKHLGFGENWHQNILHSCSGLPAVCDAQPASLDPALTQMLSGPGIQNAGFSSSTVSGSLGTESAAAPIVTSYLPYGQSDRGQCSNNGVKPSAFQDSGATTSSGENAMQYNMSSFQRLMVKLSEKFPTKTRGDVIIYLKQAKASFGNQGFRKKKLEEIVKRVGELIHQDKMSSKICSICLDVLDDDEKTLECGHIFHGECVAEWISNERTCPLCRTHALTQEEFPTLN